MRAHRNLLPVAPPSQRRVAHRSRPPRHDLKSVLRRTRLNQLPRPMRHNQPLILKNGQVLDRFNPLRRVQLQRNALLRGRFNPLRRVQRNRLRRVRRNPLRRVRKNAELRTQPSVPLLPARLNKRPGPQLRPRVRKRDQLPPSILRRRERRSPAKTPRTPSTNVVGARRGCPIAAARFISRTGYHPLSDRRARIESRHGRARA